MEIFLIAVVILAALAVFDLMVGVSNDAVNFLNSSIGSRVAPRHIIMIIASLGILVGVTFSSGMMEVARKGIFHPQYFLMPELIFLFLAVMLTDVLLLDFFNTFGLPTSTTVSIVFELLGAAVAVSIMKLLSQGDSLTLLGTYINTNKALVIISGILLSVAVAFIAGAIAQFFSRLVFTFDYEKRLPRYGAVFGGLSIAVIAYFILIKGSKGASFLTPEMVHWIKSHTWSILTGSFVISAVVLQVLMWTARINVLKPIVLLGTFALAMAFAANDLVNFVGVPLAGLTTYQLAAASEKPFDMLMEPLSHPVQSNTNLLLLAGVIMVVTLWLSRKARTVTKTEISLGRQEEGVERFGSSLFARKFVRMAIAFSDVLRLMTPVSIRRRIKDRLDSKHFRPLHAEGDAPQSFDLLRASVNLMVASAVISFATSLKLPLSTTYVTFMVAMGTSFSDQAWGRESAVYRITGVTVVIGGWFLTAFMAFTVSFVFALALYEFGVPALIVIVLFGAFVIYRNHRVHGKRAREEEDTEVFNLRKIKDSKYALTTSLGHVGMFLKEVHDTVNSGLDALFTQNLDQLREAKKSTKKIQLWSNIIVANIFKTLRLMQQEELGSGYDYSETIKALQRIAEGHRDIINRGYLHIDNNHKGLLDVQIKELKQVQLLLSGLLEETSHRLIEGRPIDLDAVATKHKELKDLSDKFDENQIRRIQDESSKTRLSILFYGIIEDSQKISRQVRNLLNLLPLELRAENNRPGQAS